MTTIRRRWKVPAATAVAVLVAAYFGGAAIPHPFASSDGALDPVDIVVFAPHPDDEAIGCGGIIQQALADGKDVRIVFSTLGDGYTQAAGVLLHKEESVLNAADYLTLGRTRQQEALEADRALGVDPEDVVFLGYPDGALDRVVASTDGTIVTSPTTGRSSTYGPAVADYHTRAHGSAAPYHRAAAVADFAEVLKQSRPSEVYVTDRADTHPDHKATYDLVKAAIAMTGYEGKVLTFLVHGGPLDTWPWPHGPTPHARFESHASKGTMHPQGLPWPPSVRVPLTVTQSSVKAYALTEHTSQWALPDDRSLLGSFIKSEEIFWTDR